RTPGRRDLRAPAAPRHPAGGQERTARSCEGGGALAYGRKPSLRIGGRPCAAAALSADRRTTRVRAHGGTDGGRTRHGRAPRPAGAPAPAPGPGTRVAGCAAHPGAPTPDVSSNYLYSALVGLKHAYEAAVSATGRP